MFVEINDIKGFIINADGFLRLGDEIPFRKHLVWSQVKDENLNQFIILPEFLALIKKISSVYPFAIVSKLPADHLSAILKNNSINISQGNIFTAGEENDLIKTFFFDRVIAKARNSIKVASCNCVYITAEHETIEKALRLHLGTILYKYKANGIEEEADECKCGPDFILDTVDDLERILTKEIVGYLGEYNACSYKARQALSTKSPVYVQFLTIPHKDMPGDSEILVTGRYFPNHDCRFMKHPLSIRLLNSKDHPERHLSLFARIIKNSVDKVSEGKYDFITCVPPKPSQENNRTKMFLEYLPTIDAQFDKKKLRPDILKCIRDHAPQHLQRGYADRRENIQGAYEATEDVKDKTIILIDDIFTTGATICELTNILLKAGCLRVYPIVIGFTPSYQFKNGKQQLKCKKCNGHLVYRINKKNGEVFWGCSGYKTNKCENMMVFEEGVKELNKQTSKISADIKVDDIDIEF
jgi:hypothetical protein